MGSLSGPAWHRISPDRPSVRTSSHWRVGKFSLQPHPSVAESKWLAVGLEKGAWVRFSAQGCG
jgi:hypothetical protein